MKTWAEDVASIGEKILSKGGVLLLLPLMICAYSRAGLRFVYSVTDNIYQLNIKDAGQIMGLKPYFSSRGYLDFDYTGDISIINFDATNLFLANGIKITKNVLLPGVGNKAAIYADLYSFHTPSYDEYRIADIILGNSLKIYFGKYLFSPEAEVRYKYYFADSINNYLEPTLQMGLGIPLPYFLLTPRLGVGFRNYLEEFVPLYTAGSHFYFPLTLDFSIAASLNFSYISYPERDYITHLQYVDDPFFEEENVNATSEINIATNRIFAKQRFLIEARLSLFNKEFYAINNLDRTDKGIDFSLQFTKFMSDNFGLHITGHSRINTSTIEDFDYIRNEVVLNFELIF